MDREYALGTAVLLAGVGLVTLALMVFQLTIGWRSSRELYGWTFVGDLPLWSVLPLVLLGLLCVAYGGSFRDRAERDGA